MSIEAPNWYTTQYDQRVSHLLQSEGFLLRGTTAPPVEVTGKTLQFFFLGKGEAKPFGPTVEEGVPANLAKTTKTVDMADWQFFEYIRHGEPEKISPEYRGMIQEAGAMALGRKFDRIIMEAMDGETTNIATIGDGTAAITPADVNTAKAKINAIGMMRQNEFFCPLPSMAWEQLKLYKVFANSDYVGPEGVFGGGMTEAKTWNNINFFQAPDEMFTAYDANSIDTYLWNRATVGFGSNFAMASKVSYENPKSAWLYNTIMSGASKVLQTDGVKRLRIKITDALSLTGT